MHNQFENLCALAITGQISDSERALLDEHILHCEECRNLIEDLCPEEKYLAPAIAGMLVVPVEPPSGIRERFLSRAAAAGLQLSAGEVLAGNETGAKVTPAHRREWLSDWLDRHLSPHSFTIRLPVVPVLAAFCMVCVYGIFHEIAIRWRYSSAQPPSYESRLTPAHISPVSPVSVQTVVLQDEKLNTELLASKKQLKYLEAKNQQLETSNGQMQGQLSNASHEVDLQSAELADQRKAVEIAGSQLAAMHQQLDDARAQSLVLDAEATLQSKQTAEAKERLTALHAEIDRMYAARGSAESMISARNLHIIDVYDTAGSGKRQPAFGRVFFVEGRSLVFYAYDLPTSSRQKNLNFQLWGEGHGSEPVTYKLGVMHADTTGSSRWVVSCDDTKILDQLRAVYIVPASPKDGAPAQNQKLMYALLGQPNHP